jgi:PiT family inorganic phosphate transporter
MGIFLLLAVGLALAFEFVNGFHDTANAVATVIYTNSLPPWLAVIWSGCWNLIGVLCSSGGVAFTMVALLPVSLVMNIGSTAGFAMMFALLISAILWNLGTWYLGLPASSTHALVGSILGVGVANAMLSKGHAMGEAVNWHEVSKVFLSLLISPLIGFFFSAGLFLLAKLLIRVPSLYKAPAKDLPPPWPVRALLVLTCTGVSYGHGSNDGQKGMGLILLILVGILPAAYALNMNANSSQIHGIANSAQAAIVSLDSRATGAKVSLTDAPDVLSSYLKTDGVISDRTYSAAAVINHDIAGELSGRQSFRDLPKGQLKPLRTKIYLLGETLGKMDSQKLIQNPSQDQALMAYQKQLKAVTQYIPAWVKVAVAIALGLGTMIGWKRIVITVGEKIGKQHLTYGQGAAAELIAMATIQLADYFHAPVSTTHVLSSGVAGTMAANHSGLQVNTLRNLLLAWVLTLPVCVILGSVIFSASLFVIFISPVEKVLLVTALIAIAIVAWEFRRRTTAVKHKRGSETRVPRPVAVI